jgi:hypothetical protein
LSLNLEDEIVHESLVTYQGRVVNPRILSLMEAAGMKPGEEVAKS